MLKLKNVSKYYYQDGVIAQGFSKVNLELNIGEFVVITGESGSGKSTLLNVLSGLDTYEDGEMYINGQETSHYTEEDYLEYRRRYVSNIFQNFNLVNSYTVYENIELAMLLNGKNKREIKKYVNELIDKVGLKKYRNTVTSKLSGGQKQRVAIARALANDTPIIVADEPTGSLDSKASKSILELLHEISHDKLVIVVTHNKSEILEYATRLIKMHDGKILENKVIENINLDKNLKEKEVFNIGFFSKIRLGIRNAFNIPIKFLLMFAIFLLIIVTLVSNYAGFKEAYYEELSYTYNNYFINDSDKRVIIKKLDNSLFNDSDYEKISNLNNIEFITKNDLINDYNVFLNNNNLYLDGYITKRNITNVDEGRMPLNDNEIVIIGNKENWFIGENTNELLNSTFKFENNNIPGNYKIVGIVYDDNLNDYSFEFYFKDTLYQKIISSMSITYNTIFINLNNNYFDQNKNRYFDILISDKVKKGEVIINDEFNYYCKNNNCIDNNLKINVKNIYYQEELNLKVNKTYNNENISKVLGINKDELYNEAIFINEEDFNYLFNKGNYQSSIFVKEIKDLDNTIKDLKNLGFETLKMRDSKQNDIEVITQIFNIIKLVVTIILIISLFFISYFIMKIIYKSRNSYYTTIRTLGGTKKVCVNILLNELITLATITYGLFLGFIFLIKSNVIKIEYFTELSKYIGIYEYILVYLILIVLSVLMANRYGRKIFKNSIIKTYGERI